MKLSTIVRFTLLLPLFCVGGVAASDDQKVSRFLQAFQHRQALQFDLGEVSLPEAYRLQQRYVARLQQQLGPVVGYKVAMSSEAAQVHFRLHEPLYGHLLEPMLLNSPAVVPLAFGSRGLIEADLLVRVGDQRINQAESVAQILPMLDAVIPFIELPDPLWSSPLTAERLLVVNCGSRLGVVGEPIPLAATQDWHQRLSRFQVELSHQTGGVSSIIGSGRGEALLGHPLQVVLWLVQKLNQQGRLLRAGDLISLGSLTAPVMPELGNYLATYRGLAADRELSVSVTFTDPTE